MLINILTVISSSSFTESVMDACTTVLSIDDTKEVFEALAPIAIRWKRIAIALNLSILDMEVIDMESGTVDEKLLKVFSKWLRREYDTEKYGLPTWTALIKAVRSKIGGGNPALAEEIKQNKLTEKTQLVTIEERY